MSIEESALLQFVASKLNDLLLSEAEGVSGSSPEDLLTDGIFQSETLRPDLVKDIRHEAKKRLASRRRSSSALRRRTKAEIATGIAAYDQLLAVCEEANQRLLNLAASRQEFWDHDPKEDASSPASLPGRMLQTLLLLTLQARGILVAAEVLAQVEGGYYDAAYARMRTLYELGVIAAALSQDDDDYTLCKRYHAAGAFEHQRHLSALQKSHEFFNWRPPSQEEIDDTAQLTAALKRRFGDEIRDPHGWAKPLFPQKRGRIDFANLDRLYYGETVRSLYVCLNHSIHAGSLGSTFHLDTTKSYLIPTRHHFSYHRASFALRMSAWLLELLTYSICRKLAPDAEDWDELFLIDVVRSCRLDVDDAFPLEPQPLDETDQ